MRWWAGIAIAAAPSNRGTEAILMMTHAIGTFAFTQWDEKPFSEDEGGVRLTHSNIRNEFHGDVEGEGTLQ
jgi:hypothetical protein